MSLWTGPIDTLKYCLWFYVTHTLEMACQMPQASVTSCPGRWKISPEERKNVSSSCCYKGFPVALSLLSSFVQYSRSAWLPTVALWFPTSLSGSPKGFHSRTWHFSLSCLRSSCDPKPSGLLSCAVDFKSAAVSMPSLKVAKELDFFSLYGSSGKTVWGGEKSLSLSPTHRGIHIHTYIQCDGLQMACFFPNQLSSLF